MNPNMISSTEIPGLDFVDDLCKSLADYGIPGEAVMKLPPGIINFISYLLADAEELEQCIIRYQKQITEQKRDLHRIRSQRNALLKRLKEEEAHQPAA